MADTREQLIEWLETGEREFANYAPEDKELFGNLPAMSRKFGEIARLLKKEEPRVCKNTVLGIDGWGGDCPACASFLVEHRNPHYCGICGQAVKWE